MKFLKDAYELTRKSFKTWKDKKPYMTGGAISFYFIFSIAPLLVIVIIIAGLAFGRQAAEGQIVQEAKDAIGEKPAQVIQDIIRKASSPPSRTLTTIISVPMLILGSSLVFYQLRSALNYLWGIEDKNRGGLKEVLHDYLFSFLMVLILGVLLLLMILKTPLILLLKNYLTRKMKIPEFFFSILDPLLTFGAIVLLFGLIYKILPEVKIKWEDVWTGSIVTSFLFTAAIFIIKLYVSTTGLSTSYGALGAVTILLIWVYYSSLVFLLGAAFTKTYWQEYGSLHKKQNKH